VAGSLAHYRKADWDYTTARTLVIKQKSPKLFSAFRQNDLFDVKLPDSDAELFSIAYTNDSDYLYIKNDEKKRFFSKEPARRKKNSVDAAFKQVYCRHKRRADYRPRYLPINIDKDL
jgi:hypothetical protein